MKQKTISYVLGFLCLLAPILFFFWVNIGYGCFFAVGSYILSSQHLVQPIGSIFLTLLQPASVFLLTCALILLWFLAGLIFLSFSISSIFMRSWSHRKKLLACCGLAGYVLTGAWIGFNPPQHQIEYALHSKIPSGSSSTQVIKVLSSQNICHDDAAVDGDLNAYVETHWESDTSYIITFHFTNDKLRNFTIDQKGWYDYQK